VADVNKRAIENFIKAGALDSLHGTRKQFMSAYIKILDQIHQEKKSSIAGQMTLFDFASEDEKTSFKGSLPDVGEYTKNTILSFEKEVLGIYVSGHPLEEVQELWEKLKTASTSDFLLDEESNEMKVVDGETVVLGGVLAEKKIKYTRNDKTMAFLTLEDLLGQVEIVVFPRTYEKYMDDLTEEEQIFVKGRVSAEDERDGKLIAEQIIPFSKVPKQIWIQFLNKGEYELGEKKLLEILSEFHGNEQIGIFLKDTKSMRVMPINNSVEICPELVSKLKDGFGNDNIKIMWPAMKYHI
jgi:DNA polymerase-3 subunit alpha